jgi:hypothetical protein
MCHRAGGPGARLVAQACVAIPLTQDSLGEDGLIGSPQIRAELAAALSTLLAHIPSPDLSPPASP